jgi:hypothetical protein
VRQIEIAEDCDVASTTARQSIAVVVVARFESIPSAAARHGVGALAPEQAVVLKSTDDEVGTGRGDETIPTRPTVEDVVTWAGARDVISRTADKLIAIAGGLVKATGRYRRPP